MVIVIAVVISPGLVHIIPMVFGSSFIRARTRLRRETAGVFCLSHVTVVLIIDLWWSENSTSCQCILTEIQNSALFTIVLTEGKYIDDVQDPISKIRLEEIIPCCWFYCSGSDFDCMALFNLLDIGIISVYSLISLLKKWFGMLIFYGDKFYHWRWGLGAFLEFQRLRPIQIWFASIIHEIRDSITLF